MTDKQAKTLTLARLHSIREHALALMIARLPHSVRERALGLICAHLFCTLPKVSGDYLMMWGDWITKKSTETLQLKLTELLIAGGFDPTTLKVVRVSQRRVKLIYMNMYLRDFIRIYGPRRLLNVTVVQTMNGEWRVFGPIRP